MLKIKNNKKTSKYDLFEYISTPFKLLGSNTFINIPEIIPKTPTIIKKPKFWILTAVAETSYRFIRCNVVIKRGEILPIKEGMQKIKAINLV